MLCRSASTACRCLRDPRQDDVAEIPEMVLFAQEIRMMRRDRLGEEFPRATRRILPEPREEACRRAAGRRESLVLMLEQFEQTGFQERFLFGWQLYAKRLLYDLRVRGETCLVHPARLLTSQYLPKPPGRYGSCGGRCSPAVSFDAGAPAGSVSGRAAGSAQRSGRPVRRNFPAVSLRLAACAESSSLAEAACSEVA